jgi:hypothetical protein
VSSSSTNQSCCFVPSTDFSIMTIQNGPQFATNQCIVWTCSSPASAHRYCISFSIFGLWCFAGLTISSCSHFGHYRHALLAPQSWAPVH